MSYRPIRTVGEAMRHGFFLEVTCRKCQRRAIFDPSAFFTSRQLGVGIDRLAARLVCEGGPSEPKGCGHRGADVRFVSWPPTPPAIEKPKPLASLAPRGINQEAWDKADERGRKRLVRQARG